MPLPSETWTKQDSRPKILVVDDQALNVRALHAMFHRECEVFMASDGAQALERCQTLLPDLILLDIDMPGLSGFDVCKQLKSNPLTAGIPVIFITALLDELDEVKGFELGAADFIRKPINPVVTKVRVHNQLELKRQADLLRSIALVDGLTGIANRRKFDDDFALTWRQCQRDATPVSLIMADVDFFKRYNDLYGHQSGDNCLQMVARSMDSILQRPRDLVARYGGEEFICLLPQTDMTGASHIAENMLAKIRDLQIEHRGSEVDKVLTLSLGVASTIPNVDESPDTLMHKADRLLYIAKHKGRARVETEEFA